MPAQRPSNPATAAQARGRFFNTGNAFNVQLPPVPDHLFTAEPVAALDPGADRADRVRPLAPTGLPVPGHHAAGAGALRAHPSRRNADHRIRGQRHHLPTSSRHRQTQARPATSTGTPATCSSCRAASLHACGCRDDAVLWVVTNEPQLAFENLRAPAAATLPPRSCTIAAGEIARQIDLIYEIGRTAEIPGSALIFSAGAAGSQPQHPADADGRDELAAGRPVAAAASAQLGGGVSLIIKGDACYSVMDGSRKDWAPWATSITPPTAVHSHHNGGNEQAMFLIVQDGGIFYHARAMGFEFAEHPNRPQRPLTITQKETSCQPTQKPSPPASRSANCTRRSAPRSAAWICARRSMRPRSANCTTSGCSIWSWCFPASTSRTPNMLPSHAISASRKSSTRRSSARSA